MGPQCSSPSRRGRDLDPRAGHGAHDPQHAARRPRCNWRRNGARRRRRPFRSGLSPPVFGVGALLPRLLSRAFGALRLAGAAYLVCLGLSRTVRSCARGASVGEHGVPVAARRPAVAFRHGLLSNLGNPKMLVFFTSRLPSSNSSGTVSLHARARPDSSAALTSVWLERLCARRRVRRAAPCVLCSGRIAHSRMLLARSSFVLRACWMANETAMIVRAWVPTMLLLLLRPSLL